jgi:hypothetical protein
MATTSADKQTAIDAGLAYLAADQNPDGSWSNGYNGSQFAAADTAAALLAFTEQSYKPLGWDGHNYSSVVANATNYLLSQASTLTGSANWWGFGAGLSGIYWTNGGEETYGTGLAIPALARLVSNPYGGPSIYSPSAVISSSNSAVNGLTYTQVIQAAVDSFTWGQTGPAYGDRYGGWRYFSGQNDSDMSTTQWPVIDYLMAKQVPGVNIPGSGQDPGNNVKTALQAWLTAVQYTATNNLGNPANIGGVDYQPGVGWTNATHAGGFLLSNYFAGGGGDKAAALAWLNANWPGITANSSWVGYNNEGNPYAMWAVYKALETLYGTTGAGPISNLDPQTTAIDSGATWNWWEDYCQYLALSQNGDGSWSGADYWTGDLATAWDINILNATETIVPPTGTPEPATMLLLGLGLIGVAGIRRKFKN